MTTNSVLAFLLFLVCFCSGNTVHDNYFEFESNCTVTVHFNMTSYIISEGQPWKGLTVNGNTIDIKAGRHGTEAPAAYFINGLTPNGAKQKNNILPFFLLRIFACFLIMFSQFRKCLKLIAFAISCANAAKKPTQTCTNIHTCTQTYKNWKKKIIFPQLIWLI